MTTLTDKVDRVSEKQDVMQEQLDINTSNINLLSGKITETTMAGGDIELEASADGRTSQEEEQGSKFPNNNKKMKLCHDEKDKKEMNNNKRKYRETNESSKENIKKGKTTVNGNSNEFNIKAAIKTFEVFLGNIDLSCNEREVVNMFSKNGITILRYEEISTRLRRAKAFWVRINYNENKIFNPTLWAQGIT